MDRKMKRIDTEAISPKILYYGMPVILLNTLNEDGTVNISPISSSWALGNMIVLGLGFGSKALENMDRNRECVLNLPSPALWKHVERLAPYTGKRPVPEYKKKNGFTYAKDKYALSGLTPLQSWFVQPTRIEECPIQLEAAVEHIRIPEHSPEFAIVETKCVQVHAHKGIIVQDHYIDPNQWSPLIYNFRHYFALGESMGRSYRAEV